MVILAILAAILVPALLGWIDNARTKQYVLDARNVYMATQAVIDEKYAADPSQPMPTSITGTDLVRVNDLSDMSVTEISDITYEDKAHITGLHIEGLKDSKTATLSSSGWAIS